MRQFSVIITLIYLSKFSRIDYVLMNFNFIDFSLNNCVSVIDNNNLILAKPKDVVKDEKNLNSVEVSTYNIRFDKNI